MTKKLITIILGLGLVFLGYAAIRGLFFRTPRAFVEQRKTYKEWAALPREPITLDAQFSAVSGGSR